MTPDLTPELKDRRCVACEGDVPPLAAEAIAQHATELDSRWEIIREQRALAADFSFRNYYRVTAFVNAVAWIAHCENHHPDIEFGYRHCRIVWTTHAAGGLTLNDFICAAKVDALLSHAP